MANIRYVTKNRLFKEAKNQQIRVFFSGMIFLTITAIILIVLLRNQVVLVQIIVIVLFLIILSEVFRAGTILRAGAKGEQNALRILNKLPKTYTIFNQVDIPFYNNSYRTQEIDYIIVGPNCIFVVEVKYKSGVISGFKDDEVWIAEKHSFKSKFKNPINQLSRQIKLLEQYFAIYEIYPKIQGALLFTHPKSILKLSREIKEVSFIDKDINGLIKKYNDKKSLIDSESIIKILCFEKERKK
ncbi:MAG: nuclease-related domain-containing protein [Candidatus Hodarchaeales archaeon]